MVTMVDVEVLDDETGVDAFVDRWDALAVEARRPYCAPTWMLAWWRHAAPPGAQLRVVVVLEGSQLLGVAPLYAEPARHGVSAYRLLAAPVSSRTEPLAAPGRERDAVRALGRALEAVSPAPDLLAFDAVDVTSAFPSAFAEGWPRTQVQRVHATAAPYVTLAGRSFDEWYAAKSRNFREQIRRRRRQLERAGAIFALAATPAETTRAVRAFVELHHRRWSWRGGSAVLTPGVEAMLLDAAPALVAAGRMRLWTIEVDGDVISAHVFLGAGDMSTYWLGGFDDGWAAQQPALQSLVAAIEHAFDAGDRLLDLGAGAQSYKYRLADGERQLAWTTLVPPGPRAVRARMLVGSRRLRRTVVQHLPGRVVIQLKRLRARRRR
jgi:CelD/BcsL family acetyltransferase involved in cellulose biosynthesis